MGRVRIVTDSTAQFLDPASVERLGIEVVPLSISLGTRVYREGQDIDPATFLRLAQQNDIPARLIAPSPEDFATVFRRLNQETDQVVALLMSRQLSQTWENALRASKTLLGRCEIVPLDSMTLSVGLALLVERAAQAAQSGASLDEIVHQVRSQSPQVYSVFYVSGLTYLRHTGLLSEAQTVLGTLLDIKPFLTIEEGKLIPMEKVRTQVQAIDKIVEFVAEFSALEQLIVLHSAPHPTERTRLLIERLATEFPGYSFPLVMYQPSLAALIGPDGVGVVVYEDPDAEDSLS